MLACRNAWELGVSWTRAASSRVSAGRPPESGHGGALWTGPVHGTGGTCGMMLLGGQTEAQSHSCLEVVPPRLLNTASITSRLSTLSQRQLASALSEPSSTHPRASCQERAAPYAV